MPSAWAKVNRIDFHYELLLFLWHRSTSLIYFLLFFSPPSYVCGSVLTKRELFYRVCMCLRMSLNARCGIVRKIGKTHLDEKGKPRCGLPSETGGKKGARVSLHHVKG